jgi:hypothetical protein
VVRLLVESWPEGKKVLSYDMKTPLQIFEHLQPNLQLNEEKEASHRYVFAGFLAFLEGFWRNCFGASSRSCCTCWWLF